MNLELKYYRRNCFTINIINDMEKTHILHLITGAKIEVYKEVADVLRKLMTKESVRRVTD